MSSLTDWKQVQYRLLCKQVFLNPGSLNIFSQFLYYRFYLCTMSVAIIDGRILRRAEIGGGTMLFSNFMKIFLMFEILL